MKSLVARSGITLIFVTALAAGQEPRTSEPGGELLYSTYCIGCHTTQMHWREKKLAKDWNSLNLEVRRWVGNLGLGIGEDDVAALARYLNGRYYHFPATDAKAPAAAGATPPGRVAASASVAALE